MSVSLSVMHACLTHFMRRRGCLSVCLLLISLTRQSYEWMMTCSQDTDVLLYFDIIGLFAEWLMTV